MPQPIDMQTELARANMADRIQQVSDRASLVAAMRARVDGERDQSLSQSQVQDTPEPQSEHVDPELRRRNPYAARKRNKRTAVDQPGRTNNSRTDGQEHSFDVSI